MKDMKDFAIILILLSSFQCFISQRQQSYQHFNDWEESTQIQMRAKKDRKFVHSEQELELTKAIPTIDCKPCKDVYPLSVFIHSAGRSSGKYFDIRQGLRNTWVSEIKKLNISVYFAIALNKNQSINDELKEESDKYEDIIQFSFIDAYYNLTLKAISILRWINKNCLTSTYILKSDNDIVVNSRQLLDKLSEFKPGLNGYMYYNALVQRDPNDKWYVPYEYYPNQRYPDYEPGLAYIMAGNITHTLLKTIDSYSGYVLDIDDAFITGIIAEKAGIARYDTQQIEWSGCFKVCPLFNASIIGECSDKQEIEESWYTWGNTSFEFCRYNFYAKTTFNVIFGVIVFCLILSGISLSAYILYNNYIK